MSKIENLLIPCDRGGFSYNPNIDTISAYQMVDDTKNLNLMHGGRKPRGGTSQVTGVSMASRVMGLKHFKLRGGVDFVVRATADGKIYKNDTTTIHTGWATNRKVRFEVMNELLFACNGYDKPRYWDGSAGTITEITTIHADWTGTNFPSKFLIHGRGVSRRMWAWGCPNTPYSVYFSANDNPNVYSSGGGGGVIDVDTGDDIGITDGIVYGDRLMVFGKHRTYIISDDDTNSANWGYQEAQWVGGCLQDMLIRTPNDIVAFAETGDIYSVLAAQEYGDYIYASLSNPHASRVSLSDNPYITKWIQEYIDLSAHANNHAVYDQTNRCIKFFLTPLGYTTNKIAVLYFIDRPPQEAWMIHSNLSYGSGYDASCSAEVEVEVSDGTYQVYTGDYSGILWKLETANLNDNSNPYYKGFVTPYKHTGNPVNKNVFLKTKVIMQPKGDHNLSINTWVDNNQLAQANISIGGVGLTLDSFVLDTDTLGGDKVIHDSKSDGASGYRIKQEFFNNSINEDFFISQIVNLFQRCGAEV